jgi:hypothetical protein
LAPKGRSGAASHEKQRMNPMSSENRRLGRGWPATESPSRRDNEGGRRGRFVCVRRLLSPVFRPLRAEPRPQRRDPAGVPPWKRQRPFAMAGWRQAQPARVRAPQWGAAK